MVTVTDQHCEMLDQTVRVFGVTPDHDLLSDYAEYEAMSRVSNPYCAGTRACGLLACPHSSFLRSDL